MKYSVKFLGMMAAAGLGSSAAFAAVPEFEDYQAEYTNRYEVTKRIWSTCTHVESLPRVKAPGELDNLSITELKGITLGDEYCYTNTLESGSSLSDIAADLNSYAKLSAENPAKAVLTVVMDKNSGALKFCTRAGDEWVFLAGKTPANLYTDSWDIKIEVDSSLKDASGNAAYKARYSVKDVTAGDSDYTVLTLADGETEWIDSPFVTARQPSGVQLVGAAVLDASVENPAVEQTATRPAYVEVASFDYELSYGYTNVVAKLSLESDGGDPRTRYGEDLKAVFSLFDQDETLLQTIDTGVIPSEQVDVTVDFSKYVTAGNTYYVRLDFCASDAVNMVTNIYDQIVLSSSGGSVTVEDDKITIVGSQNLDLSREDLVAGTAYTVDHQAGNVAYRYEWTDSANKYAKLVDGKLVVKSGKPANGYPSFFSHLLGLDADTESSQPGFATMLSTEADYGQFAISGIAPKNDLATFEYELDCSTTKDGEYTPVAGAAQMPGPALKFPIDMGDGGRVRFYKVKVTTTLK